jgi:alpha-beta hydrolase superfamily lysophospholipase
VLYTTTGLNGEPIPVSGLILAPEGESDTPRPVLAYSRGTVGVIPACGTSYLSDPFANIPNAQILIDEGFVITATDYPGLGTSGVHPYLVGTIEAASVLDSVRVARQLATGAGDTFASWGNSQGGHAALWTAQTAAAYAPELTLIGVAASAPAIDLSGIFSFNYGTSGGAFVVSMALYAWSFFYPEIDLDALITPEYRASFEAAAQSCFTNPYGILLLGLQSKISPPEDYLAFDPLETEAYRQVIEANTPSGDINVPILITHGAADTLIPIEGSINAAAMRCERGEDVQLVRYPATEHDSSAHAGLMVIGWIQDRFAGRPTSPNCD